MIMCQGKGCTSIAITDVYADGTSCSVYVCGMGICVREAKASITSDFPGRLIRTRPIPR